MAIAGIAVMIEQTITIGNIIEIASILAGGLTVFITLKNRVTDITSEISGMQTELKKLNDVVTKMAVTDLRVTNLEQDIRELRHGRGFVQGHRGIEGEYA